MMKGKRTPKSAVFWKSSSSRASFLRASLQDQCGRADGYILEGKELEFYLRKIKARKGKYILLPPFWHVKKKKTRLM